MLKFSEYLLLTERRPSRDPNFEDNKKFIQEYYDRTDFRSAVYFQYIKRLLIYFRRAIDSYDPKLLDPQETSLRKLYSLIQKHSIPLHVQSDKNYRRNKEFLASQHPDIPKELQSAKIRQLKAEFKKRIESFDQSLISKDETDLRKMDDIIKQYKIPELTNDTTKRKHDWKIHEQDIVAGINALFHDGFFVKHSKKTHVDSPVIVTKPSANTYHADSRGGARLADVEVMNPSGDSFFVECKLNLATARYLKFKLHIVNKTLHYDHRFHLQGLDSSKEADKQQSDALKERFEKKINIDAFISDILKSKDINDHWQQTLDNIKDVVKFIYNADEFKEFTSGHHFDYNFPDGFKDIAVIFDTYCDYYIDKYNKLIDQIFKLIVSKKIAADKASYKIQKRTTSKSAHDNEVFKTLADLETRLEGEKLKSGKPAVSDEDKLVLLIKEIKVIEAKFSALLKIVGKHLKDANSIKDMETLDKVKYFFKMFVSAVGHKRKGIHMLLKDDAEDLGNMLLCPEHEYEGDRLAKIITDYYVGKDHCAYIQIADTVFQFLPDWNPLGIPDLPIFSEAATHYVISFGVNDKTLDIGLQIALAEFNEKAKAGKNIVSFKKNDSNYVMKKLKNVTIEMP